MRTVGRFGVEAFLSIVFSLLIVVMGIDAVRPNAPLSGDMPATAGNEDTPPRPESAVESGDPFGEFLQTQSPEVVKTGPSCSFVRIKLPPGVSPDEIPGL